MKRVNIEQARKLKELGFDKETDYSYVNHFNGQETKTILFNGNPNWNDMIRAPYIAEALEWIRNEKGILCNVEYQFDHERERIDNKIIVEWLGVYGGHDNVEYTEYYLTYEEAESALLDELIRILEKK